MDAEDHRGAEERAGTRRRQLRPPGQRPGHRAQHRPQHRGATRHQPVGDRQHALRRLRPAAGIDDLQRHEPVSRRHGSRSELLAEPGDAEGGLGQHLRRRAERHPVVGRRRRLLQQRHYLQRRDHLEPSAPPSASAATGSAPRAQHQPAPQPASSATQHHEHGASTGAVPASRSAHAAQNLALNQLTNSGRGGASTGASIAPVSETMVPLAAFASYGPAPRRWRSIIRVRSSPRRSRSICPKASRSSTAIAAIAAHDAADCTCRSRCTARSPARRRCSSSRCQNEPLADRRGHRRGLYRARRAVRELRSSDHDPVDAALGRRRRGAGAAAVRHRVQPDRADRRDPADRHRQEERHHDDRCRARDRAHAQGRSRARPSTMPACCAFDRS